MNMTLQLRPHPPKAAATQVASMTSLHKNLRLDPSRALEPSRKKLTTVEAQRVMSVFEETIRRVEIVTLLPFIMENLDRFRVSFGGELHDLLKHHSVIISSYEEIRRELDHQLAQQAAQEAGRSPSGSVSGDIKPGRLQNTVHVLLFSLTHSCTIGGCRLYYIVHQLFYGL